MEELKPGDVVYLKSGGPAMTIAKPAMFKEPYEGMGNWFECIWFRECNMHVGAFAAETLTKTKQIPL